MDEFTPGNTDSERRGRVAYERYCASTGGRSAVSGALLPDWAEQSSTIRDAWCHAAEAAFEEGRAFEVAEQQRQDGRDGVVLQAGETMVSYVYRTARGSTVAVDCLR